MSVISRFTAISLLGASLAIAAPASANLIQNGSFENPDIPTGTWDAFDSTGVTGWAGDRIEIWDNYNGVNAYHESQFAELNADPSDPDGFFSIFQSFSTVDGQWYDLSFAYRARQSDTEEFKVGAAGIEWSLTDHTTGAWSLFNGSFEATSATTTLMFTSVIPASGTIGNFIDDVRVTASVPEPGTLALLALGLAGLGLRRRK
ncbi:PEP-CTERM sorting domain-containing protein [Marinobacter confluentis]|uniref:PEP-CTERM sorting domain-containing protein n=1 Tax=Marinobacter confluentis TaxID=1697557 RepID=A0A4Z1C6M1_9GAMM|nr:PEP-CTERM sorting domain-containing protein [Marinobacter confluentis]TGN38895.1 PEP-CTERM sorting domain-containing protein [Marinobacter confluentis]